MPLPPPAPAYSIVVVTWQCADYLRGLVQSMNLHLEGDEELVVIDSASSDDPGAAASGWKGPTVFRRLESNVGFGAATNVGVQACAGEAVVMLNPDAEVIDGSLRDLSVEALRLGGLVGPRVLNPDGTVQPSASGPEVGPWPWVRALLPGPLTPRPLLRWTEPYRLERETSVTWLTGSCIAGPRQVLLRLGPFDPALHMYGEDIDLGLRAEAAGIPRRLRPDLCRVVHHGAGSSTEAYGSRHGWRREGTRNWRAALRRAYGPRRETRAWRALRLNLELRHLSKRALRRLGPRDRAALEAVRNSSPVPELPNRR